MKVTNTKIAAFVTLSAAGLLASALVARQLFASPWVEPAQLAPVTAQPAQLNPDVADRIVSIAQQRLPQSGVLSQTDAGFIFVDVPDAYIHDLFTEIKQIPGVEKPAYFTPPRDIGAHISVIDYGELEAIDRRIQELGCEYLFSVRNCKVVADGRGREWVILEVDSPALELFRKTYGLAPKLHGHAFHITIGVKA